jgi:RHS repeat-associated protein
MEPNTIQYLYDNDRAVAEYNGTGTLLRKYIYGPGLDEPIMMIVPGDPNETVYYYHYDNLGSVIGLTNDTGAWVEKYAYTLYGKPAAASTVGNPYMYTGRRLDTETGLYYYRARFYDPNLRRFIETDPIGFDGGMNLYAYVGNNPLNWIDPWGEGRYSITKPETHGAPEHVHWGRKGRPRRGGAIYRDGSLRHGEDPPNKVKELINKKYNWNLKIRNIYLLFIFDWQKKIFGGTGLVAVATR